MNSTANSAGEQEPLGHLTLGPLVGGGAGDVPLAVLGEFDAVEGHAESAELLA